MFRLWIGVCAPFFSSSEGTGKHFVLLKSLLFSHGWMPAQGRCSKTLWGVRKAKKCHLCQRDSKVWSAQGLGPASPWNTSWHGAARGFHTGCAPLDDGTNLPQPQHFWPRRALFPWRILTTTQLVQRDLLLLSPYCCFQTLATSISLGISLGQRL